MANTILQARSLRSTMTRAEYILWSHLRNRRLQGLKFRRQQPVPPYIADFACVDAMLIVELDGSQHLEQARYDGQRDEFLKKKGFRVLRFWNNQALAETDLVLEEILNVARARILEHRNGRAGAG